jgi:hypothetical protein
LALALLFLLSLGSGASQEGDPKRNEQAFTGLKPLNEMTADDRYKGEDGGLYGGGRNDAPEAHLRAAKRELERIVPLGPLGNPLKEGKIGLLSVGMSNTYGEFRYFKEQADRDGKKAPPVILVNGAVGGAGAASWAKGAEGVWNTAQERLKEADLTPEQVQVAWMKHADPGPSPDTTPLEYAHKLRDWEQSILQLLKSRFPNLRVCYLSSRIYGGYNAAGLRRVNPEPFAYESAFSVRWLIQDQIKGDPRLNYDPAKGPVRSPLLLWGPYLWADGIHPRKSDGLAWERKDLGEDGVHPSPAGGRKVADLLLNFFMSDPLARTWFVRK